MNNIGYRKMTRSIKRRSGFWSVKRREAAAAKAGNCRIFFKETDTCVRKDWLLVFFGAKCYTFFIARFFGHFSFFFCLRKIVSLLFRVCNCWVILLKIGRWAILMCRLYNNTKISVFNLFCKLTFIKHHFSLICPIRFYKNSVWQVKQTGKVGNTAKIFFDNVKQMTKAFLLSIWF